MLKLTEAQGDAIRAIKQDLEADGFKNVIIRLRPAFERIGSKQEPLFWQIWPRLRVAITFDVVRTDVDKPSATTPEDRET